MRSSFPSTSNRRPMQPPLQSIRPPKLRHKDCMDYSPSYRRDNLFGRVGVTAFFCCTGITRFAAFLSRAQITSAFTAARITRAGVTPTLGTARIIALFARTRIATTLWCAWLTSRMDLCCKPCSRNVETNRKYRRQDSRGEHFARKRNH